MIARLAAQTLKEMSLSYPVVVLTGPRQAGKSTLSKLVFPEKEYVSLEDLDQREFALSDPRAFLQRYKKGAIIDEVQRVPSLLSYIQTEVDGNKEMGRFILTGSAQLTLLSTVSQSLAGRAGLLTLLPFSFLELKAAGVAPTRLDQMLFCGSYPPIYDRDLSSLRWCSDYIQTYIERDVRQILNIQDLGNFQRFMRLCAARAGQLLNLSSLAADSGISHTTAREWINVLEATYIIFQLQPHFNNFSKRLIKSPKLYFYDTGVLCTLLGIQKEEQLAIHPTRGSIFESWVISEFYKTIFSRRSLPNLFFWRDQQGLEVDVLVDHASKLMPIEIKSGQTIASDWFDSLGTWSRYAGKVAEKRWLIYGGSDRQSRSQVEVLPWDQIEEVMTFI